MNKVRRSIVGTVVKGGGAVSLGSIPAVWSKPIVESVILPAHAQTTSCARLITLDQLSISCGDSTVDEISSFFIDESGPCPLLETYPDGAGVEGLITARVRFTGQIYELIVSLGRLDDTGSIDSSVGYEAHILGDNACPDPDPVQNETGDVAFEVQGSAGGRYNVTAVASTDLSTSTVSITNILITPVE